MFFHLATLPVYFSVLFPFVPPRTGLAGHTLVWGQSPAVTAGSPQTLA